MNSQLNLAYSRAARDRGIKKVSARNEEWLTAMRQLAVEMICAKGSVAADELRDEAERRGMKSPDCKEAYGAIFRCRLFERIGFKESALKSAHARVIGIFSLKGGNHGTANNI